MKDLVIFGTGGVGRQVAQIVKDVNAERSTWNLLGFLDDDERLHGQAIHGLRVLGGIGWLQENPHCHTVVAIGSPKIRCQVVQRMHSFGVRLFATIVHPTCWIGDRCVVGEGSIVYPGVLIDTDVSIGTHAILNKSSTVGHDTVLEDYVTLAPGVNLGGMVHVGTGCEFGISSVTIQKIMVGAWAVVGAGAVVVRDVPSGATVVGVPARPIKRATADE